MTLCLIIKWPDFANVTTTSSGVWLIIQRVPEVFIGHFKNRRLHGEGKLIYEGETLSGKFEEGRLIKGARKRESEERK